MNIRSAAARYEKPRFAETEFDPFDVPAFAPLLFDCPEFIDDLPQIKEVPPGTDLIEQGDLIQDVQLIRSGLVKLKHVSCDGRETTLGLRAAGWYAGSGAALLNSRSAYGVRAVTPCSVAYIDAQEFSRKLRDDSAMTRHFVSILCQELAAQVNMQVQVTSNSAEHRLEHFMRERVSQHPSRKTLDPLPHLKQMEVAQLLSVTPEHLSRLTNRRRSAHAVSLNRIS